MGNLCICAPKPTVEGEINLEETDGDIIDKVATYIEEKIAENPRRLPEDDNVSKVKPPPGVSIPSQRLFRLHHPHEVPSSSSPPCKAHAVATPWPPPFSCCAVLGLHLTTACF